MRDRDAEKWGYGQFLVGNPNLVLVFSFILTVSHILTLLFENCRKIFENLFSQKLRNFWYQKLSSLRFYCFLIRMKSKILLNFVSCRTLLKMGEKMIKRGEESKDFLGRQLLILFLDSPFTLRTHKYRITKKIYFKKIILIQYRSKVY